VVNTFSAAACIIERSQIKRGAIFTVQNKRIFIRLETADQRINAAVITAKNRLDLMLKLPGSRDCGIRIEGKTGTAALLVATREVIGHQNQDSPTFTNLLMNIVGHHLAKMRPAEIEHAAKVAEGLNNAERRTGSNRDVDPAIHAFHDRDGSRMPGLIALTRQGNFRGGKRRSVPRSVLKQPLHTLGYWSLMIGLHKRSPEINLWESLDQTTAMI
jgi:hypothetical protein